MIDGLDGLGKGVIIDAIRESLQEKKLKIFDLETFWKKYNDHPDFENTHFGNKPNSFFVDSDSFDVLLSAEPTFVGVGSAIRFEAIAKNKRPYDAKTIAEMYALDRLILYQRVILPLLKKGKIIIQSRGVITSLVYQEFQAKNEGLNLTQND